MSVKGQWFAGVAIVAMAVAVGSAQTAGTSKTSQTATKAATQAKDAAAKPMTWTNMKVSDSMCGAGPHKMAGGKAEDCTAACVKGGSKYVLVDKDNKVYQVENQKDPELAKHAGHNNLSVTGTMKGDSITVTKIVMPPAKGK